MFYNIFSVIKKDGNVEFLMNESFTEDDYRILVADQVQRNISNDPDSLEMGDITQKLQRVLFTCIYHEKIKEGCQSLLIKTPDQKSKDELEVIVRGLPDEKWTAALIPLEELENERTTADED